MVERILLNISCAGPSMPAKYSSTVLARVFAFDLELPLDCGFFMGSMLMLQSILHQTKSKHEGHEGTRRRREQCSHFEALAGATPFAWAEKKLASGSRGSPFRATITASAFSSAPASVVWVCSSPKSGFTLSGPNCS